MPNPNAMLVINFNLKLDKSTDDQLIGLARERHEPKSQTVRSLIRGAFKMTHDRQPTCATGTTCLCPHVHTYPPRLPPADPDAGRTAGD